MFKVEVWEGLCGEAGVGCRSGSVMVDVVDAWSDEGAMFVGIVGRWTDYLGSLLKVISVLHDHARGFTSSAARSTCTDALVGQPATSNPSMVSRSSLHGWLFSTISFRPASSVLGATGVLCAGL